MHTRHISCAAHPGKHLNGREKILKRENLTFVNLPERGNKKGEFTLLTRDLRPAFFLAPRRRASPFANTRLSPSRNGDNRKGRGDSGAAGNSFLYHASIKLKATGAALIEKGLEFPAEQRPHTSGPEESPKCEKRVQLTQTKLEQKCIRPQ